MSHMKCSTNPTHLKLSNKLTLKSKQHKKFLQAKKKNLNEAINSRSHFLLPKIEKLLINFIHIMLFLR